MIAVSLYAHGNVLLRKFGLCSSEVKQQLFHSYCANFYCCSLWTSYNKTTYNKVKVAYNNIARRLLGYDYRDVASHMFVTNSLDSMKIVLRKNMYNLKVHVETSNNSIVKTICDNFYLSSCGNIYKCWQAALYTLC